MNETNAFLDVIGYSPQAKILDVLITGSGLEYSATGIIRASEIARASFYKVFPQMLKKQLIIATKKIGNIQLYKINQKNPSVQFLMQLYKQALKDVLQKYKATHPKRAEEAELLA